MPVLRAPLVSTLGCGGLTEVQVVGFWGLGLRISGSRVLGLGSNEFRM